MVSSVVAAVSLLAPVVPDPPAALGNWADAETWPSVPGALLAFDTSRVLVERTTWPLGSNVSLALVVWVRSSSALTCTRARPSPTISASMSSTRVRRRFSTLDRALIGLAGEHGIVAAVTAGGQQRARVVDDGDALRGEAFDGGGDQVLDGADFAGREYAADREDDRGGGVLLLALEQLTFRQDEMDPAGLDAGEGGDGAGEFALQRSDIVDILNEAGGAQRILLIEDLVADLTARRQAVFGKRHAHRGDLVARHEDGVTIAADFVGDVLGLQLGDDGSRVFE